MKKINMLIAVLAIIAAAPAAKAESTIDFDAKPKSRSMHGIFTDSRPQVSAKASLAGEKMIYGEDDRVDYYAMPENLKWAADSTVSLWKRNSMWENKEADTYILGTYNFGEGYNLCPGTKFSEQPAGAFCSGALVGEDLVMTAGHCIVTEGDCNSAAFVFGYAVTEAGGKARTEIPSGEVYTCSKIIKRELVSVTTTVDNIPTTVPGADYALIKLDRKVKGHKPLPINRAGGLKKGVPLFVTGHPTGLPFKFAGNARVVRDVDEELSYFYTNLDTFGGNSGSPVFNAETLLIEGIHVRREEQHFIPTFEGCNTYLVRPPGVGTGGHVTKVDFLADEIPPTAEESAAQAYAGASLKELRLQDFSGQKNVNFDFR